MELWKFLFFLPILLAFGAGLWQVASPLAAWKLRRLHAKSRGLATTDEPDEGALRVIRWQGVALVLFALAFSIALVLMFRGFEQ
jgi:hypothetical protein